MRAVVASAALDLGGGVGKLGKTLLPELLSGREKMAGKKAFFRGWRSSQSGRQVNFLPATCKDKNKRARMRGFADRSVADAEKNLQKP